MTIPEKIVWLFEHRVTEAHRSAIERPLSLTPEQFDAAIPQARDLGAEMGLRLTPIYDRDGWWTARPTHRIAARALYEAAVRNNGEAERNARVYRGFGKAGHVGDQAAVVASVIRGTKAQLVTSLPERTLTVDTDYIVTLVDQAIAEGHGYVERLREPAAA